MFQAQEDLDHDISQLTAAGLTEVFVWFKSSLRDNLHFLFLEECF